MLINDTFNYVAIYLLNFSEIENSKLRRKKLRKKKVFIFDFKNITLLKYEINFIINRLTCYRKTSWYYPTLDTRKISNILE